MGIITQNACVRSDFSSACNTSWYFFADYPIMKIPNDISVFDFGIFCNKRMFYQRFSFFNFRNIISLFSREKWRKMCIKCIRIFIHTNAQLLNLFIVSFNSSCSCNLTNSFPREMGNFSVYKILNHQQREERYSGLFVNGTHLQFYTVSYHD